jgi:hypothetical protein
MHTFRGSFPFVGNCLRISYCAIMQILVLSSNTKKGEIERTFPKFWVLDNNTSDSSNVWCDVGHWYILYIGGDPLKL